MITSSYFKAPTWGRSRPRPQIRPPRPFEVVTKVNLEGLSDLRSDLPGHSDQNLKSVDFKGRLFLYASRVYYSSHWGRLRPRPPFRPHWYDSYLLHSKFQSWQMRSLLTLDIWKNTSMDAIQIIETTHETKPKVNNMYRMRHNFMLSTSWIYWNTLWLLSNCFKIIICTHYSFLILLL